MFRLLSSLSLLLIGCAADTMNPPSVDSSPRGKSDDVDRIVNQGDRDDIAVIRAEPSALQVHGSIVNQCAVIEIVNGPLVRMDCTDAVDALIAEYLSATALLAHRFTPLAYENDDGSYSPSSSGLPCQLTRVVTATRSAAFDDMLELGFYFSGSSRTYRLLGQGDLTAVDEAIGVDDHPRTIHEFYAALPCWAGTASSSYYAQYEFKPFVDFAGQDGNIYRNWDVVPHDYVLTGGAGATQFDRTHEVLKQ